MSLGGSQTPPSFWRIPGLPRISPPHFPGSFPATLENEKSARSFPEQSFSKPTLGHGRPRLRVKDVRAKNYIFLSSERWGESFWAGTSARVSAWTSAGYPAQNLMFRLLLRFPATCLELLLLWSSRAIQRFPWSFPDLPANCQTSPEVPRPPGGQALFKRA